MNKLLILFFLLMTGQVFAQSTATQTVPGTYLTSGNVTNFSPASTSTPIPISITDLGNHSGYCFTSNGSGSPATFQSCGGGSGSGTVTSVTFTGDGTVLSSTPSSAVTTSGTLTANLATQTANTVLGATSTALSALSLPSCSTSSSALLWTSGTGFSCNSAIVASTSATVTSATQANITSAANLATVGTIGTGVWQGSLVAGQYGGTGVSNTGKTLTLGGSLTTTGAATPTLAFGATGYTYTYPSATSTLLATNGSGSSLTFGTGSLSLGGSLTTSGAFGTTFTVSGTTALTLPTSGTVTALGNTVTGSGGTLVESTTPTFTTSIIDPLHIGGSAGNDTLTLESTSSATHTTDSIVFKTGAQATAATFASNGGLTVGSPTGGNKGTGTINATGLYVNGTAVGTGTTSCTSSSSIGMVGDGTTANDTAFAAWASGLTSIGGCLELGIGTYKFTGAQTINFANSAGWATTSTSTVTVGTGTKTFTVASGLSITNGNTATAYTGAGSATMTGTVTSYSGTTLVLSIASTTGSGSASAWSVVQNYANTNAVEAITIKGQGADTSTLYFPTTAGIAFNLYSQQNAVHLKGFSITTGTTAAGTAINLTNNYPFFGTFVAQSDIQDVTIRGADGYALGDYWTTGVNVVNVSDINFNNFDVYGGNSGLLGTGINLASPGAGCFASPVTCGTIYNVVNSNFTFVQNGITLGANSQTLEVTNSEFLQCQNGIDIPSSAGTLQGLQVSNSTFFTIQYAVVGLTAVPNIFISNNLIDAGAGYYAVSIVESNGSINNNNFIPRTTANSAAGGISIAAASGNVMTIQGNSFSSVGQAIFLQSGTSGIVYGPDAFTGNTGNVLDLGSNFALEPQLNGLLSYNSAATSGAAGTLAANSLTSGVNLVVSSNSTAGGNGSQSTLLSLPRTGANANTGHTAVALSATVGNTGTSSTNIAGYFSAFSGTTNIAIEVPPGGGSVGIGTATPGSILDVNGITTLESYTIGTLLCVGAGHQLGHCTASASCLSTCTCTCTVP